MVCFHGKMLGIWHHFLSPNHLAWCHCFWSIWCQPSSFGVYLYNGVTAGQIKAEGCECAGGQCSVLWAVWFTSNTSVTIHLLSQSSVSVSLTPTTTKKFELSLFQNLHLSLSLSLLPLLACTYLNNAWGLVLLALPLYVCLFKINRFMYSQL